MVFQWKVPKYKVDAQDAGEELLRIGDKYEALTPENVVEESRPEDSVLHNCFDWDDKVAAEKYRINQSQDLIRNITTVQIEDAVLHEPVRAFVSIETKEYVPVSVVVKQKELTEIMLENALKELNAFRNKYAALQPLAEVFQSIENVISQYPM